MNEKFERRVDDLGRILIPKEIRRKLGIKENDVMQISEQDGKIVIEKVVGCDIKKFLDNIPCYINAVSDMLKAQIIVTDLVTVIAEYKVPRSASVDKIREPLSNAFITALNSNMPINGNDSIFSTFNGLPNVTKYDEDNHVDTPYSVSYIYDKLDNVIGSVVIYNTTAESKVMTDSIANYIMAKM